MPAAKFMNSKYSCVKGIHFLELNEKDYYDTGYAYGALLKKAKHPSVAFFTNPFVKAVTKLIYLWTKRFQKTIRFPDEYNDELRGYSDATGIPLKNLITYNNWFDLVPKLGNFCTTVSYFSDNNVFVARNTDTYSYLTKRAVKIMPPVLVSVKIPEKNKYFHTGLPFIAGAITGWNEKGIGVFNHQISHVKHAPTDKYSTSLIGRILLENACNIQQAEKYTKQYISNRPANILVTDAKNKKHAVFETHPENFAKVSSNTNYLTCATVFRKLKYQDSRKTKNGWKRNNSAVKLASELKNPKVNEFISLLKDTSNGIKFEGTGVSIANEGTYMSFVIDIKNNTIYMSNGKKPPVALTGEHVKIKMKSK